MRQKRAQKPVVDPEEAGRKARDKRVEACNKAINEVLEAHNCQMSVVFQSGNQLVPLNTLLNLPFSILISSK